MKETRLLIKGNEAVGYGAIAAGCTCYFGYPITPQNEIPEMLSQALPAAGGAFVQAESELAASNMLLGAAAAGARAMTSSSSPGISLMQETLSYLAGSELPAVIVNMNRGGPGLGDIGSAQGDYYQSTRGGGHGDYRTLVLAPSTCQEAYDMMGEAFDLAFKYRNPVLVLGDGIVGTMKEPVTLKDMGAIDNHGVEGWRANGARGREKRLIKSLRLEEGALAAHNTKLQAKYQAMRSEARAEEFMTDKAELIVVAYGSIGRMAKSAIRKLREQGHSVGLVRPVTLYPFPEEPLKALARKGARFLTIEHNAGQMVDDVRLALRTLADSDFHALMPGNIPSAEDFVPPILAALGRKQ
ncbi:MAG: 3-methyl-2-oxobutanoate dehydrogenase subunit VorB [Deltaproteobacteria bacterium]|jgi:2-oxoglutarate ferredoxin oxidoreductase subunit alpha|nr:3-methyl-2-oxobutanoate dehydrogenase subunit VorB [Deltaproteobacteria bacterium]